MVTPTGYHIQIGELQFPQAFKAVPDGWEQFSLRLGNNTAHAAGQVKEERIRFLSIGPGAEGSPWFALFKAME